jgi:RNA methyltransferase, TrmH family
LFVCEGVRAVEELLRSSLTPTGVLVAAPLLEAPRGAALRDALRDTNVVVEEVKPLEFHSAAETDSPQGVLAIAPIPERGFGDIVPADGMRVLLLDALQDPGNVGTILRTAAALGVTATVAFPGTVDLWNAKVVRSAMGAHFHHLCFASTWYAFDAFRARSDVSVWAADASGVPLGSVPVPRRVALVVGNEGAGLSADVPPRAQQTIALPLARGVESLNVAVATGILLYEMSK